MRKQLPLHSSFLLLQFCCLQKYFLNFSSFPVYAGKRININAKAEMMFSFFQTASFSFTNLTAIDPDETVK